MFSDYEVNDPIRSRIFRKGTIFFKNTTRMKNKIHITNKFCIFRFVRIGKNSYLCRVFVTFAKTDISFITRKKV